MTLDEAHLILNTKRGDEAEKVLRVSVLAPRFSSAADLSMIFAAL